MRCLKCKKEISNDLIRCNHCNTKVQTVCPICGAKNPLTTEFCDGCGLQLLKYCDNCGCVNLPSATSCRKCATEFDNSGIITIADIKAMAEVSNSKTDEKPLELSKIDDYEHEENTQIKQTIEVKEDTSKDLLELDEKVLDKQEQAEENKVSEDLIDIESTPEISKENTEINLKFLDEQIQIPDEKSDEQNLEENTENQNSTDESEKELEEEQIGTIDQMKCKNNIVSAIRSTDKLIIGMSAPEGCGKSTVLKYLFNDLMNQNYAWFWGECSANSQISPFGIFQEMILTFFNMPNFSNMSQEFLKQAKTMLSQTLPAFTNEEINNLFNFLYPHMMSNFEEILFNKDRTFALLEKLILELSQKAKLIIVIDDFDMIDGASYAFLTNFVDKGHLNENIKLLITFKDDRITQGYFYSEKIAENQYEDIKLAKLTAVDTDNLVKMFLNGKNALPKEIFKQIYRNSSGNSAYVEQILVLFNEQQSFKPDGDSVKFVADIQPEDLPKSIYDVLAKRLEYLEEQYPKAYKTLCTAAIMGNKFNVKLLEIIMKYSQEDFQESIQILSNSAYISHFNNNISEFKNTLLWRYVYERAKQSKDFVVLNEKIYDIISSFTLSSNALKALIAQSLNQKLLALNIWTDNIKLCAYLGDEHLWTLSQKQCLKIAQEVNPENNNVIINNIQERLGKLLYTSKPSEAIEFLGGAISNAIKVNNQPKIIELAGYLSKSCSITGNYNGVIEAIDTILQYLPEENKLEQALIKYKKVKAMFSIGNAEEIYNLASNDIIPVLEKTLSGVLPNNGINMDKIYEAWLECNLTVAMALTSQGNKKALDILYVIDDIIERNKVNNINYLHRVQLAKALAHSVQGNIKVSEDILVDFTQETSHENVEPEIISMWNFINILNKIYKHDWKDIKNDMYSVVTFANNYNDVLVKNLLKVFLGKILQEEGSLAKALDIFNEQVTIFANEKIAIGALLCWYFIAKITLVTEGTDKAIEISQKALDVAKNPKISNYYFMVLFKKLMAETYMIKGDMEATKMYIEKALLIAKQYDMRLLKVSLFQLYAKYLEEMAVKKPQNKANYAQNTITTYKKVMALAQNLGIPEIEEEIKKNYASFKAFCQLNGISL